MLWDMRFSVMCSTMPKIYYNTFELKKKKNCLQSEGVGGLANISYKASSEQIAPGTSGN
jgi:hypothetical protein